MEKRQGRQLRSLPAKFETRELDDELYIEGYFAVFNSEYVVFDDTEFGGGRGVEVIAPGAFDGETEEDVRALVDHETHLVLGRTTAETLALSQDERGLWGRIRINKLDQDAMNLYARVKRGDVDQCSFGFDIVDEEREHDGVTTKWTIKRVKLYEVSVVTFPAYKDTGVEARRQEQEQETRRRRESWRAEMLARLKK